MTVLVDSWAWVEYLRATRTGAKVRPYLEGDQEIIASSVNIAEVYGWALREFDEPTAEDFHAAMLAKVDVVPLDDAIAVVAARARRTHRWGLGDAVVFATARAKNARILTGDAHFRGLPETIFIG